MSPRLAATPPPYEGENGAASGEQLIKSRDRVKAHGEVFTPRHMVDRMLDIACSGLESGPAFIDTTFFEPAAGDGNFLLAILQRKLGVVAELFAPAAWPVESLFALASIYGVELLEDNHRAAQETLLEEFVAFHAAAGVPCNRRTNLWRSARYLIRTNTVQGNTVTGKTPTGADIQFSWWHRIENEPAMVQRDPFTLSSLREASSGAFDFNTYAVYAPCRIDHVHKEVRADD